MLEILENHPTVSLNTFRDQIIARFIIKSDSPENIADFITQKKLPYLIVGNGSNLLFTKDFEGILVIPHFFGKAVIDENDKVVLLKVGASENFDELVAYTVQQNWGGLENLSLIPGTIGAAPYQNIGAYGVEAKDRIFKVSVFDLKKKKSIDFSPEACEFSYRDSFFKHHPNRYLITSVTFLLTKQGYHQYNISYGNLQESKGNQPLNLEIIRNTVIQIRQSKLPDYRDLPNAGSFFKNPIIDETHFKSLHAAYPAMPIYPLSTGSYKISAAWLIDQCGFKGKVINGVIAYIKQPLVLCKINPEISGKNVLAYSEKIQEAVLKKFNIFLEREVAVY